MIKLVQITRTGYGQHKISNIYLNPQHIIYMSEHEPLKQELMEGKINLGLDKNATFTRIKISEGDHLSEVVVVGDPATIESKIFSNHRKKVLKG
jgi:hypothetical protein